jgi:hypothetical protein
MGVGTGAVEEGAVGRRSFLRAGTSTKNDVEGFSAPARAARSEASAGEYEGIAEGDAPAPTPDPDAPSVWRCARAGCLPSRILCCRRRKSYISPAVIFFLTGLPVSSLIGMRLHRSFLSVQLRQGRKGSVSQTSPAFKHRSHCH